VGGKRALKGNSKMLSPTPNTGAARRAFAQSAHRYSVRNKPKVLLAEDHEDSREMLRIMLKMQG
jgi:hypothetical protein